MIKLSALFWGVCIVFLTIGDSFNTFIEISTDFFKTMYGLKYQTSANFVSIMTFMPIIYGIIIGIIADKYTQKGLLYIISSILSTVSFLYVCLKPINMDNG